MNIPITTTIALLPPFLSLIEHTSQFKSISDTHDTHGFFLWNFTLSLLMKFRIIFVWNLLCKTPAPYVRLDIGGHGTRAVAVTVSWQTYLLIFGINSKKIILDSVSILLSITMCTSVIHVKLTSLHFMRNFLHTEISKLMTTGTLENLIVNTLRPRQNYHHFPDFLKCTFVIK